MRGLGVRTGQVASRPTDHAANCMDLAETGVAGAIQRSNNTHAAPGSSTFALVRAPFRGQHPITMITGGSQRCIRMHRGCAEGPRLCKEVRTLRQLRILTSSTQAITGGA